MNKMATLSYQRYFNWKKTREKVVSFVSIR